MHESFSYANVSPQRPGFNRGIWKRLENQVRTWASDLSANDTLGLMVWAGPVLEPEPERWGRLLVPQRFYKIVYHPAQKRVVACLMQNASSQEDISATMVTVDSIENITGLDFLAGLPDDEEERLESGLCRTCWVWTKPVRR
jgi:endonuclease G